MSNLISHAEYELKKAGLFDKDSDYEGEIGPAVMAMVKVFSEQGHSGMSAGIVAAILEKLLRFEPLGALTGTDDEWVEVTPGIFQNRRCSHVFKTAELGAYDIDGKIFRYPDGSCYTSKDSRVPVTFPYTPKREYVDVPAPRGRGFLMTPQSKGPASGKTAADPMIPDTTQPLDAAAVDSSWLVSRCQDALREEGVQGTVQGSRTLRAALEIILSRAQASIASFRAPALRSPRPSPAPAGVLEAKLRELLEKVFREFGRKFATYRQFGNVLEDIEREYRALPTPATPAPAGDRGLEVAEYRVTYTLLRPSPAGPFKGRSIETIKYQREDHIRSPFGLAEVKSCRKIKPNPKPGA